MAHSHLILLLLSAAMLAAAASAQVKPKKQTLYLIPHTHWEGAVFFTREEYLERYLSHILTAVHLMQKYAEYKFALDQAAYVKPFLERYPEEAQAFRKFVAEGRLQLVGGMDVMPDDVKPGGELFVRGMQYGQGFFKKEFGAENTVCWLLDTFGHHPQMPQLLNQAGFKSFWFCRGVPNDKVFSEFDWRGIDGSTIPAFWLPGFYGLFCEPPRDAAGFAKFFADRFHYLDPFATGPERVGLAGMDVTDPEQYVPDLVRGFNKQPDSPFTIRHSSPVEFAELVAKRKDRPVLDLDLNPIFQGTYSSRIELHQATREIERKLLTAETLSVLSHPSGSPTDDKALWQAWEPLIFNQCHDTASGVMTDPVYEDTVQSYEFSKRLAGQIVEERLGDLLARIDTRGEGIPVVVFNGLGSPRTDVVEVDLGFTEPGVHGVKILDPAGKAVSVQFAASELYEDGGLRRVKARFLVHGVPPIGYAVYRAVPTKSVETPPQAGGDTLENEFYKITVNLKTGEILSILDKALKAQMLSGPANVVARQADDGDFWEMYHTLDGGMYIASTDRQAVPAKSDSVLSNMFADQEGTVVRGPVYSEFSVAHPFADGTFSTRVRLCAGVPRIDVETVLVNNQKHVRYQVLFPTAIEKGRNVQEIPFGAVERPIGTEYPAQNWVDYGDGKRGVALLNAGMPGNLVTDGTMMLSLMRSEDLVGYNEGRPSGSGFELGVPRTFRYSLIPHAGDWRQAQAYRRGQEFNAPLLVRKAAPHAGDLPETWGYVKISQPNVILTALKPGPAKTFIVRVYEASGKSTKGVTVKFGTKIASAYATNLLEAGGRKLHVEDDSVRFDLHPFEILTLKLKPY